MRPDPYLFAFIFTLCLGHASCDKASSREHIMALACKKNRNLPFCEPELVQRNKVMSEPEPVQPMQVTRSPETAAQTQASRAPEVTQQPVVSRDSEAIQERTSKAISSRQEPAFIKQDPEPEFHKVGPLFEKSAGRTYESTPLTPFGVDSTGQSTSKKASQQVKLSPAEMEELRQQCLKVLPVASKFCNGSTNSPKDVQQKCLAYIRDCNAYIPKADPMYALSHSFMSSVGIIPQMFEMNGIPYYPINQEGSIGEMQKISVPFGTFGGGFSDYQGVRDYWSQYLEAGGNWIDGDYGYKTGWSMPLVQSLGVEGGGGTHVAVPLTGPNFGKIGVDSGYGVGPYYGHNDHTGVDWRQGSFNHQFGVGVPFVGFGTNTGTAVSWPSANTWMRALSGLSG